MSGEIKEHRVNPYEYNVLDVRISRSINHAAGLEATFNNLINELNATRHGFSAGAETITIWPLLEWCHPYRKEIINAFNTLNEIGACPHLIAAAMGLQGWKNFFGDRDWTACDVHELLIRHGTKKEVGIDGAQ